MKSLLSYDQVLESHRIRKRIEPLQGRIYELENENDKLRRKIGEAWKLVNEVAGQECWGWLNENKIYALKDLTTPSSLTDKKLTTEEPKAVEESKEIFWANTNNTVWGVTSLERIKHKMDRFDLSWAERSREGKLYEEDRTEVLEAAADHESNGNYDVGQFLRNLTFLPNPPDKRND